MVVYDDPEEEAKAEQPEAHVEAHATIAEKVH